MKKTLLIAAFAGLAFVSCKKDYTCSCTNTTVSVTSTEPGFTYTPQAPTTSKTTYTKIKKSNVNAQMCVSSESVWTENDYGFVGGNLVNYVITYTQKSECELTK